MISQPAQTSRKAGVDAEHVVAVGDEGLPGPTAVMGDQPEPRGGSRGVVLGDGEGAR